MMDNAHHNLSAVKTHYPMKLSYRVSELYSKLKADISIRNPVSLPTQQDFFEILFLVNSTLTDRDPGTGLEIPFGFKIMHSTGMTY
jgi:hypothetical protein